MIDEDIKEKLLTEIEKSGNVYFSCLKLSVDRSTYYRWKKSDSDFRKRAKVAEKYGRENLCDVAKQGLGIRLKEKNMEAIKYTLGHLDPQFKARPNTSVTILHKTTAKGIIPKGESAEDYFDRLHWGDGNPAQKNQSKIIMSAGYRLALPDGTIA